ncbi:MAG: diguanylate cyclase, partial [Gammaproteobacteria bacterium]|nr:diguanylate cyclase [Gammaproteobacteria bacterium]
MNRLLQRHLRRLALDPGSPPGTAEWQAFLERVEHAYEDGERGRYLLERSLEISSREMQDLYEELAQFTQAQIASEQSKFETVVGAMADGVLAAALDDGQLLVMNAAAREVLGDIKQVSMKHFEVHDDSGERLDDEAVRTIIRSGGTLRDDHALVRGRRGVEASLSITPLSRHGQVDAYVLTFRDMEEQILLQRELRRAAEIFENVREAVIVTDADARVIQVNRAFTAMSGQTVEDVRGQVPGFLSETTYDAGFLSALWEAVHKRGSWRGEVRDRRSGGESYPLEVSIAAVNDHDDRLTNYIVIARDVSELRRAQESVDYLVHHDPLTGLPNRLLLRNRLDLAIREARSGNHNVALLHLDLDDFKTVNDSLGHGAGDMLLKEVARRLSASVSANDLLGRLGADEFCVVMRRPAGAGAAAATARRLLEVIAAPMQLEGRETVVTASTGISLYPMDGEDVHSLVKNADTALHRAKEVDRNHYEFYTEELSASAFERLSMESALRRAIRQNEFELFYQPQVALADGRICGAEALLRWRHPELGVLTPRHFLRLAEEIGLTLELGEWVLAAACQQIRRWRDSGHSSPRIAINLFGRQVQSTSLPAI